LDREKKFPERKHFRILAPGRQQEIDGEDHEVGGQDTQRAPGKEAAELDPLPARDGRKELAADQVTTKDKKEIDPDPTETVDAAGQSEPEQRGVVNDDDDDRESAKEIETRLALAVRKARIDSRFVSRRANARNLAALREKENSLRQATAVRPD
jgi:hypothetical protein